MFKKFYIPIPHPITACSTLSLHPTLQMCSTPCWFAPHDKKYNYESRFFYCIMHCTILLPLIIPVCIAVFGVTLFVKSWKLRYMSGNIEYGWNNVQTIFFSIFDINIETFWDEIHVRNKVSFYIWISQITVFYVDSNDFLQVCSTPSTFPCKIKKNVLNMIF